MPYFLTENITCKKLYLIDQSLHPEKCYLSGLWAVVDQPMGPYIFNLTNGLMTIQIGTREDWIGW